MNTANSPSNRQGISDDSLTPSGVLNVHCDWCRVCHFSQATLSGVRADRQTDQLLLLGQTSVMVQTHRGERHFQPSVDNHLMRRHWSCYIEALLHIRHADIDIEVSINTEIL